MGLDLIWHERVPYYLEYNNDSYERAMESLRAADPRVIVFQGDAGICFFCWLYRYQLYGPNRAIFVGPFADSNAKTIIIPEYVSEWCNEDMVRTVMNNTFIYGEHNRGDLYPHVPDDSGMTLAKFKEDIGKKVDQIENWVYLYEPAKFFYYDLMLFTGMVLNEAERLLISNNDSLINWSVGSDNFQENGQLISDIFKEAIFNVKVVGMRGIYGFDREPTLNSRGFTPIKIEQTFFQPDDFAVHSKVVAIFDHTVKEENERLTIANDQLHWSTLDGKPPFDRVQMKPIEVKNLNPSVVYAMIAVAIGNCLILGFFYVKRKLFKILEINLITFSLLIGNGHIFLLPLRDIEPIASHCSILTALFLCGFGIYFIGLWSLLEKQLQEISTMAKDVNSKRISLPASSQNALANNKLIRLSLLWIAVATLLAMSVAFAVQSPFQSIGQQLTMEDTFGQRQVEFSTRKSCVAHFDIATIVAISIIIANVATSAIKSIFVSFQIQFIKKTVKLQIRSSNTKRMSSIYFEEPRNNRHSFVFLFTLTLATALIAVLIPEQMFYISSLATIALDFGSIAFLFTKIGT